MERLTKRNLGIATDQQRFSQALLNLTETSKGTYATDTNDVPLLNEGISSTAKHLNTSQSLLEDEAKGWDEGVLEDLKKQRDTLVSLRDMFDRRERFARDNIPQLERRIESNENRLSSLMAGSGGKPGEQEKLESAVRAVRHLVDLFTLCRYCVELTIFRTSNRSLTSMLAASLSKSASGMNWLSSSNRSIMSVACIRTGVKNASSMPSSKRRIGVLSVKR